MAFPVVVFAGASSARGPSIPMGFLYSLVYLGILTAFAVGEKVSPPMGRQSTISLSFKDADIVRACGDGESILHSMQYSLIKRQRSLASEGTGDDMQKVCVGASPDRALVTRAPRVILPQVSLLQKDIEAAFRSWRSGATFMRAGDLETALDTFVRLFRSGVTEPFVPCTIGLLAASMGDVTSGIEFILLVRGV